MNIYQVKSNLINTINGKERLLSELNVVDGNTNVRRFLKLNISELKAILADVEICCQQENVRS